MTDWNFELKLRCCNNPGIRIGSWLVCPDHDWAPFVRQVRKLHMAEWVWNFEPPRRPWLENRKDYW